MQDAKGPCATPVPCVPVAIAPANACCEMEPRQCSARPYLAGSSCVAQSNKFYCNMQKPRTSLSVSMVVPAWNVTMLPLTATMRFM